MHIFKAFGFVFIIFLVGCQSAPKAGRYKKITKQMMSSQKDLAFLSSQLYIYSSDFVEAEKTLERSLAWMSESSEDRIKFELMLARVEIELGKRLEAHQRYTKLLDNQKFSVEVASEAAKFFYEIGLKQKSFELYGLLTELNPKQSNFWIYKGLLSLELGNFKLAWESFDYLIRNSKDADYLGYYYMGKLMKVTGQEKQASIVFRHCLKLNSDFSDCALELALQEYAYKNYKQAKKILNDYLKGSDVGQKLILSQLAQWQLIAGEFEGAQHSLEKLERIEPKDIDTKRRLGLVLAYRKNFTAALERLKVITSSKSVNEGDVLNYVNILMLTEGREQVFAYMESVKGLEVLGREFFFRRQKNHSLLGREVFKGKELCRGVTAKDSCLYVQGVLAFEKKKFKEASRAFKGLTQVSFKDPENFYLYGKVLYERGLYKKSEKAFQRALALNEEYLPVLNFQAYSLAQKGVKLNLAKSLILRVLSKEPGNGQFLDTYGYILLKLLRPEEALDVLLAAVRQSPKEAEIYEHLGDTYLALEQSPEALKFYMLARKLYKGENSIRLGGKIANTSQKISTPKRGISSFPSGLNGDDE